MKSFKLWLEKDKEIPQFQRLCFRIEELALSKILKEGIHPVGSTKDIHGSECCHISDKLSGIVNNQELYISEIAEFDFCSNIYLRGVYNREWDESSVREILTNIRDAVYFVERLDFQELSEISKETIKKRWNYDTAKNLLMATQRDFNHIRVFLKSKNKAIKLSGYEDLKKYQLHEVLSPSDFEDDEKAIIKEGLPILNFRKVSFIEKISTQEGYLSMVSEITNFQLVFLESGEFSKDDLAYNCRRISDQVVMIPDIKDSERKRPLAKQVASKWGEDNGKYCFHVGIDHVEEMISSNAFQILFPSLTYQNDCAHVSTIRLRNEELDKYHIGGYTSSESTADEIRQVLKAFNISQTGKKEELLKKLIRHAAEVYNLKKFEMNDFFSKNRFIYIPNYWQDAKDGFKVLEGSPIRNLLLSMYAVQHMRGNAILEVSHENDAYDVKDLARAVINGDVNVQGTFIRVEDG
jgi:hypothetical protein